MEYPGLVDTNTDTAPALKVRFQDTRPTQIYFSSWVVLTFTTWALGEQLALSGEREEHNATVVPTSDYFQWKGRRVVETSTRTSGMHHSMGLDLPRARQTNG